ncbi:hypothetical protein PACID_10580 [Acidipropionibacterium acidipropionici ATCC 4875]|uniref:Uncharacterized protein n=1 Tax=Acidipropionibacterium acidipropionici (strain ATCC 4875 / DSM 20272 / JCM 6432 / NBRC 12425 / NCIMB 8070 / 4) TaxID=1171373 RepID=K7S2W6_ACIA4|nr:hypothetical protein [Acidipropionibacterium acidipropionici]AFV88882.1 hypothetical protein PACID_10580 [Acidipropionibacterium acidipropionici ATCC 4875]
MDVAVAKMLALIGEQMKAMLPDASAYARDIMAPLNRRLQEQMKSVLPDYDALVKNALEPYNELIQSQVASIGASLPTFTAPMIDFPALKGAGVSPAIESMLKQIASQQSAMLDGLRGSLKPLFDPEMLRGFNRALLPPNLRSHAGEVQAHQVHEFLEQEGIPLYLVPRGRTALRLLRAQDRPGRRRVLGDCYESITDDCAIVLEQANRDVVGDELKFVLDGLGAMRSGHFRSAQAMFTVTLDTLIYRFYPDQAVRRRITNRKKGADVPDAIDEMGVPEAMVWLPIWNAHEQFWKHKGDKVPNYYSRHASVHGVSSRQFSKRNCVQVLMLVTSLIGFADRLMSSAGRAKA